MSWKIFTPLLHELEEKMIRPLPYVRGSRGPQEADKLRDGHGFVRSVDYDWKESFVSRVLFVCYNKLDIEQTIQIVFSKNGCCKSSCAVCRMLSS